jgi:hypothetical protein
MALTALSAVLLATWRPDPFLLGIGLFTGYLVASGWVWIRPAPLPTRVARARMAAGGGLLAAAFMVVVALAQGRLPLVLLVFAGIMTALSLVDLTRTPDASEVAARHGGRMGGAYIAAWTAFLVVNLERVPDLIVWLGPTVVGTPLIVLAIRRHRSRSQAGG